MYVTAISVDFNNTAVQNMKNNMERNQCASVDVAQKMKSLRGCKITKKGIYETL